ncbi:hypothetical protein GOP47_0030303 [Adiantum capillus-veneris]|nr:hypothetical protein GOP47_0030303 [Adiantum capillus-veneris]
MPEHELWRVQKPICLPGEREQGRLERSDEDMLLSQESCKRTFCFLDYGAEFMCSQFSPIREIWALSGLTERKSADADWNWGFHQQQASLHNSSTYLVSKDGFDGSTATVLKSDITKYDAKTSSESSILCEASNTQLCSHSRRNRPKRVHMIPTVDSNAASIVSQKETVLSCIAKGHACVSLLPVRTSLIQNECAGTCQEASRLISSCVPSCGDKICLASLACDEKMKPLEKNSLDFSHTQTGLTDLILSESHPYAIDPSLLKSARFITNKVSDEKGDLKVGNAGGFDVTDKEMEMLGKALCHAQTRARLAEKLAEQTLQERDMIQELLIKETWTVNTYRQRALTLEIENRLLRLYRKLELGLWANKENALIFKPVQARSKELSNLAKNQYPLQNRKESHISRSSHGKRRKLNRGVSLSCAVGFAFVLGLSIAGSGILIVWSVGWMFS